MASDQGIETHLKFHHGDENRSHTCGGTLEPVSGMSYLQIKGYLNSGFKQHLADFECDSSHLRLCSPSLKTSTTPRPTPTICNAPNAAFLPLISNSSISRPCASHARTAPSVTSATAVLTKRAITRHSNVTRSITIRGSGSLKSAPSATLSHMRRQ